MTVFSVDHLDVFDRPGATVTKREDPRVRVAGCWVKFDDGWTVSIQWGNGNYCSNYDNDFDSPAQDATTAEIAVWEGDKGDLKTWADGDTVQGYCSMERVQHVLDLVAEGELEKEFVPSGTPLTRLDDGWEGDDA